MKKLISVSLSIFWLLNIIPVASAEEVETTTDRVVNVVIEDISVEIDPSSNEESFTKVCYLVDAGVREDGTSVMRCTDIAPRYGTYMDLMMIINKVSPFRYSVEVQAHTVGTRLLIKSFTAVLDYGNGERVQGWGVNNPPLIGGCSTTMSQITYPDCVYTTSGKYTLKLVSYRLVACEYGNIDNTEEVGLFPDSEVLIVGEEG